MGSFIKIDRKILKWEWWSDINTHRLFVFMLIVAYWKDSKYKGKDIPRGSFPSSISELSRETNLTENEVRTAIKHLKSTGEITSKTYNKFTVFTIKNYDLYQSDNKQNDEQVTGEITSKSQADNEQITSKSQAVNELLTSTILKEDKEDKKERKEKKKEDNKGDILDGLLLEISISDYLLEYVKDWLGYKQERNFTYKERGLKTLLKTIAEYSRRYGDESVADIINKSISSGYQGIVFDKLEQNTRNNMNGGGIDWSKV